jgi:hypothetical protein
VLEVQDASQVRKRLKTLPRDSTEAFKSVIERMTDRPFAGRILGWILRARSSLTMAELQAFLAFDVEDLKFHLEDQYDPKSIVNTCGGLVEHRQDTDLVTFSHALVQQYLTDHPLDELASHSDIALPCVSYTAYVLRCLEDDGKSADEVFFEAGAEIKFGAAKGMREPQLTQLGAYATSFWSTHARLAGRDAKVEKKILEVFTPRSKRNALLKIVSDDYDEVERPLLVFLVKNRMAGIVMNPLSDVSSIVDVYSFSEFS